MRNKHVRFQKNTVFISGKNACNDAFFVNDFVDFEQCILISDKPYHLHSKVGITVIQG